MLCFLGCALLCLVGVVRKRAVLRLLNRLLPCCVMLYCAVLCRIGELRCVVWCYSVLCCAALRRAVLFAIVFLSMCFGIPLR